MTVYAFPESRTHIPDVDDPSVWAHHARYLPGLLASIRWWIGDLLAHAPDQASFVDVLNGLPGLEPGETALCQRVAETIPPARRRGDVAWQVSAVASELADPAVVDRLVDDAAVNNQSVQDVRSAITQARPKSKPRPGGLAALMEEHS